MYSVRFKAVFDQRKFQAGRIFDSFASEADKVHFISKYILIIIVIFPKIKIFKIIMMLSNLIF